MRQLKDFDRKLAKVLLEAVERKEFRVTYKEVAERVSPRLGHTVNPHYELAYPLGTVSSLCHELGLPLISAMVRYSNAKSANAVGEGFYPLACELKPEYKGHDPVVVWREELDQIRKCQEWHRLRDYLDGATVAVPTKASGSVTIANPFMEWMGKNTALSGNSIAKYYGAIGTISREMFERGVISKQLQNMNTFELDIAISAILKHSYFIEKNARGNHMYSNALKQYRYFMNTTYEEKEPPEYIVAIKNDTTISETERTAIIQSRVGQGAFRKSLMEKYRGCCIITGIDHPKLLVASHIKPWAVSTNEERLSVNNGLLLSATYDRLFDCGLITFDKMGRLHLSRFIGDENVKRLRLEEDMQFDLHLDGHMGEYLDYHSDVLFVR